MDKAEDPSTLAMAQARKSSRPPKGQKGPKPSETVTMEEILFEEEDSNGTKRYLVSCYNSRGDQPELWITEDQLVRTTSSGRRNVPPILRKWMLEKRV